MKQIISFASFVIHLSIHPIHSSIYQSIYPSTLYSIYSDDQTRVCLKRVPGSEESDYINANYIDMYMYVYIHTYMYIHTYIDEIHVGFGANIGRFVSIYNLPNLVDY